MNKAKEINLEELEEQMHPERVDDVIFWALDEYSKRNKGKWGATIAHSIIDRIKEEEKTECVK